MIHSIILLNFRNYKFKSIEFTESINFIEGRNGVGKTNLLEAISMLSLSSGFRGADTNDLNGDFKIPFSLGFETSIGSIGISNMNSTKKILLNNEVVKFGKLEEKFKIFSILPEDEFIFIIGSSKRREFFDKMCSIINPQHATAIKSFKSLCLTRNKILANYQYDEAWLGVVEKQIAQLFVILAINRVIFCEEVSSVMNCSTNSSLLGNLIVTGSIENKVKDTNFKAIIEENDIAEALKNYRNLDKLTGKTLTGFQKANFDIFFAEKGLFASKSSSGEQKRMLFAFIIALVKKSITRNSIPIILIDEMVSKLDKSSRNIILQELKNLGVQSFLTGTETYGIEQTFCKIFL